MVSEEVGGTDRRQHDWEGTALGGPVSEGAALEALSKLVTTMKDNNMLELTTPIKCMIL